MLCGNKSAQSTKKHTLVSKCENNFKGLNGDHGPYNSSSGLWKNGINLWISKTNYYRSQIDWYKSRKFNNEHLHKIRKVTAYGQRR